MKKILLWVMTVLFMGAIQAQDFSFSLDGVSKVIINTDNRVKLIGHEHDYLLLKEVENEDHKSPERAEGLRDVNARGQDNTGYGVEIRRDNNKLIVNSLLDELEDELIIRLPKSMNLSVTSLMRSSVTIEGFDSEIEAQNYKGDILMKDVRGPIVAQNDDGDIIIQFSSLSQASPTSIVMENGEVDITLPENTNATINSKLTHGKLYTDFKLENKQNGRSMTARLNGGGVQMFLQNLAGNIYLRKRR